MDVSVQGPIPADRLSHEIHFGEIVPQFGETQPIVRTSTSIHGGYASISERGTVQLEVHSLWGELVHSLILAHLIKCSGLASCAR